MRCFLALWLDLSTKPSDTDSVMNEPFSDCTELDMVDHIFGSASEFARQVELNGNNFTYEGVRVEYDEDEDTHYFFYADEA